MTQAKIENEFYEIRNMFWEVQEKQNVALQRLDAFHAQIREYSRGLSREEFSNLIRENDEGLDNINRLEKEKIVLNAKVKTSDDKVKKLEAKAKKLEEENKRLRDIMLQRTPRKIDHIPSTPPILSQLTASQLNSRTPGRLKFMDYSDDVMTVDEETYFSPRARQREIEKMPFSPIPPPSQEFVLTESINLDKPGYDIISPRKTGNKFVTIVPHRNGNNSKSKGEIFDQQIDKDLLLSSKKPNVFERNLMSHLPTPQSNMKKKPGLESWLSKASKSNETAQNNDGKETDELETGNSEINQQEIIEISDSSIETPVRRLDRRERKRRACELLKKKIEEKGDWDITDFVINEVANEGYSYAFQEVVRGEKRKCIHGRACKDCDKWFSKYAPVDPSYNGPRWGKESEVGLPVAKRQNTAKSSRHRDRWRKPESPPGFWRSDFPSTQEIEEERAIAEKRRTEEAMRRLDEAMNNGQFLFRDEELRKLVDEANNG